MNPEFFIKLSGCICVFSSSLLIGVLLEKKLKQRYLFFLEMNAALTCLEQEMLQQRQLLPQALKKAARCCRAGPEKIFHYTAEKLPGYNGAFETLWKEAVYRCISCELFTEEEKQLFEQISDALCSSDVILQKTLFDTYRMQLQQLSSDAKRIWREKSGLYRKLSAAGGLFLILLLL